MERRGFILSATSFSLAIGLSGCSESTGSNSDGPSDNNSSSNPNPPEAAKCQAFLNSVNPKAADVRGEMAILYEDEGMTREVARLVTTTDGVMVSPEGSERSSFLCDSSAFPTATPSAAQATETGNGTEHPAVESVTEVGGGVKVTLRVAASGQATQTQDGASSQSLGGLLNIVFDAAVTFAVFLRFLPANPSSLDILLAIVRLLVDAEVAATETDTPTRSLTTSAEVIRVTDLSVEGVPRSGEATAVSLTAQNFGEEAATRILSIRVDGDNIGRFEISLSSEESATREAEWTPTETGAAIVMAGDLSVEVFVETGSAPPVDGSNPIPALGAPER